MLFKKITILVALLSTTGFARQSDAGGIKLSANYVPPMCDDAQISRFMPTELESTSEAQFRKAMCLFFRSTQDRLAEPVEETEFDENKQILLLLEKSKTAGLGGNKQPLTTYMETILHCRQSQFHQQQFSGSNQGEVAITSENLMSVLEFCTERDMASASVSEIDWATFDVTFDAGFEPVYDNPIQQHEQYVVPEKFKNGLEELIQVYSSCYEGGRACSPGMHHLCGRSIQINPDVIQEIAAEAVGEMLEYYFASTGPITAMLSKKKDRANNIIGRYEKKIDYLVEKSGEIQEKLENNLKPTFENQIKKNLDIYLGKYKDSFVKIYEVNDWLKRWEVGLMTSLTGRPMKTYLDEKVEELKGIEEDLASQQTRLEQLRKKLINLADRKNRYNRATYVYCGIYYCEFSQAIEANYDAHQEVCASTDFAYSPLCDQSLTLDLDAVGEFKSKSIQQICKDAGFQEEYVSDEYGEFLDMCFTDMQTNLTSLSVQ